MTMISASPAPASAPTGARRLLAATAVDLAEHLRRNGPVPWQGAPRRLVDLVRHAGLTGRGGAGFPAWRKLAAVADGQRPVVIGNGAEGEPASSKDRTLLTDAPHVVLDGLQLAAEAVGSTECYLYLPAGPAADRVRHALAERSAARWDAVAVRTVEAPDEFVAGEESAVVSRISGGRPVPRDKRRLVVESGVHGRPTLVQNVETLAHLAMIARHGPEWFRRQGTHTEPGTFLATLSGAVAAPGVYEAPHGIPLGGLLDLAGGSAGPLRAVLIGGYHGAWLPVAGLTGTPMTRQDLAPFGASLGAGVVYALSATICGLAQTARIVTYLAERSARQCGPCLNGLPRMADTLAALAGAERRPELVSETHRLAALVENRGACHHPDGTVRLVRSALRTFAAEVDLHLAGRCSVRQH